MLQNLLRSFHQQLLKKVDSSSLSKEFSTTRLISLYLACRLDSGDLVYFHEPFATAVKLILVQGHEIATKVF
jgi:hypothetical protein